MATRDDTVPTASGAPTILSAAGLIVLGLAAFAPAFRNAYVNWDDGPYLIANPLPSDLDHAVRLNPGTLLAAERIRQGFPPTDTQPASRDAGPTTSQP